MTFFRHSLAAALAVAAVTTFAQDAKVGSITVSGAQARATVPGQTAGGGFLRLDNQGPADRLVSATAPVSARVELHTMRMEGDVMRMRQIDAIELPAGGKVELKPGGMHLMFMELKAPLKAGEIVPVTLRFEKAGEVTVKMPVQVPTLPTAAAASGHEHKH